MLLHVVTEIAIDTVHEPLQLSRQQLIQLDVLQFALLAILVLFEHLLHLFLPLGLRFWELEVDEELTRILCRHSGHEYCSREASIILFSPFATKEYVGLTAEVHFLNLVHVDDQITIICRRFQRIWTEVDQHIFTKVRVKFLSGRNIQWLVSQSNFDGKLQFAYFDFASAYLVFLNNVYLGVLLWVDGYVLMKTVQAARIAINTRT